MDLEAVEDHAIEGLCFRQVEFGDIILIERDHLVRVIPAARAPVNNASLPQHRTLS
jgi:hypothetical protein